MVAVLVELNNIKKMRRK